MGVRKAGYECPGYDEVRAGDRARPEKSHVLLPSRIHVRSGWRRCGRTQGARAVADAETQQTTCNERAADLGEAGVLSIRAIHARAARSAADLLPTVSQKSSSARLPPFLTYIEQQCIRLLGMDMG